MTDKMRGEIAKIIEDSWKDTSEKCCSYDYADKILDIRIDEEKIEQIIVKMGCSVARAGQYASAIAKEMRETYTKTNAISGQDRRGVK